MKKDAKLPPFSQNYGNTIHRRNMQIIPSRNERTRNRGQNYRQYKYQIPQEKIIPIFNNPYNMKKFNVRQYTLLRT